MVCAGIADKGYTLKSVSHTVVASKRHVYVTLSINVWPLSSCTCLEPRFLEIKVYMPKSASDGLMVCLFLFPNQFELSPPDTQSATCSITPECIFERIPLPYIRPCNSATSATFTTNGMLHSSDMNAVSKHTKRRFHIFNIYQVKRKIVRSRKPFFPIVYVFKT